MPEDLPRAVMVLTWLLVGVIIFGYLLWQEQLLASLLFAIVFYGVPTVVYTKWQRQNDAQG